MVNFRSDKKYTSTGTATDGYDLFVDRVDGVDILFAKDINDLADSVQETQKSLVDGYATTDLLPSAVSFEDGQTLVYDSATSKMVAGASGDASFKIQSVATNGTTTIKGGSLILDDGRELVTYDGGGTATSDILVDLTTVDLDTLSLIEGGSASSGTTYYLYIDSNALGASFTITAGASTGREVFGVEAGDFVLSASTPKNVNLTRFVPLGFVRNTGGANAWSTTIFGSLAFRRHDLGTLTEAWGSGGTNYFTNGRFEVNVTDGVTESGSLVSGVFANSSTQLEGDQSARLTTQSAAVGHVDFEIDGIDPYVEGSINTLVTALIRTDGNDADGDWTVGVYNTTDASYTSNETDVVSGNINNFRTTFVPLSGKDYVLRVRMKNNAASGRVADVDKLVCTPDNNAGLAPIVTEWKSYTPVTQGLGGITNVRTQWRQVGESIEVMGDMRAGVLPASTELQIGLPNGYTVDWLTSPDHNVVGYLERDTFGGVRSHQFPIIADQGDTFVNVGRDISDFDDNTLNPANSDEVVGNILRFSIFFSVPVAELKDSKINLIDQNLVAANAQASYSLATVSPNYSTFTAVQWTSRDKEHPGFTLQSGQGAGDDQIFTANFTGRVRALVSCYNNTVNWTNTDNGGIAVVRPGEANPINFINAIQLGDSWQGSRLGQATFEFDVTKGDTFSFNLGEGGALVNSSSATYLTLTRVAEYGAFEPVGFGLATSKTAGLVKSYVEGTFVPIIDASTSSPTATYNVQTGKYTKIGNLVHVTVHLNLASLSGGSGQAEIGNLPFTSSAAQAQSAFMYRGNIVAIAGTFEHYIRPNPSDTAASIEYKDNSVNSTLAVSIGSLNLSQDLIVSLWYFTDD